MRYTAEELAASRELRLEVALSEALRGLAFYADRDQWLNDREIRGFPGFHGGAVAMTAVRNAERVRDGEVGPGMGLTLDEAKAEGILDAPKREQPPGPPNPPSERPRSYADEHGDLPGYGGES